MLVPDSRESLRSAPSSSSRLSPLCHLCLLPPSSNLCLLDPSLSYSSQALEKKIPFSLFLEKSVGFINPTNVNHLAGELGLEVKGESLMGSLAGRFRQETYASSLRRDQASKWAYKHVAQGNDNSCCY